MALALNNLKRVDMPLNKETKPNLYNFVSPSKNSDEGLLKQKRFKRLLSFVMNSSLLDYFVFLFSLSLYIYIYISIYIYIYIYIYKDLALNNSQWYMV